MPGPLRLPRLNPSRHVSCTNPCTNQLSGQLVPVGQHDRLIPTQRAREHLIRRSGHIVQDRPLRSVCWADIPELSVRVRRCPAAWQQYWQQSLRSRYWSRPSVFQAGHIPSSPRNVWCPWALLTADACRWLLLLLSALLSAAVGRMDARIVQRNGPRPVRQAPTGPGLPAFDC